MADSENHSQNETDEQIIRKALKSIIEDTQAPAAARAQAARTLAEMAQLLGRNQRDPVDDVTPVKELSREQMQAQLWAMKEAKSG